ncbi:MAG: tetratricopeptide repeat protein [Thermodesulfobacteriota bacterium]
MKKAILILVVLIFSLLYYMGALAKKETLPFSKEFFSIETAPPEDRPFNPKGLWEQVSQGSGRKVPTRKALEQLYQLKLDRGVRNLPVLSHFLDREARRAREQGDPEEAISLATYAIKFSPDLPQPYYELARIVWLRSPFQLPQVLTEISRGMIAQFHHYPSSLKFFYNLFFILSNALLMTFIVFGIVILAKYLPLYFYDLRRNLIQNVKGMVLASAKILVLLIPFFLRLDILWSFMYWSIFLWGYAIKRERVMLLIFFVLLVYLPFFLRSASSLLDSPHSEILLQMSRANHEDWDRTLEKKFQAWLSTHPGDAEALFTLGLMAKREGRYEEAEQWYKKSLEQSPQFGEAISNLGNVYLAKKKIDLAIASYLQARELHPGNGAYYYNLYRAYAQETFLSGKMSEAFEKARQLDPKRVDYYASIDSPNLNRQVIDEVLRSQRFWGRLLDQFSGKEGVPYRLFMAWFAKISSRVYLLPVFFLGFLIGMSRVAQRKRFLNRCPMCGSPTFRFYLGESDRESICFNCHRIFVQKEKIHPKIKEKKILQVAQFQKKNHRLSQFLSTLFVGFGDLWEGRSSYGLLLLFLFFVFIVRFVYWDGALRLSLPEPSLSVVRAVFWGGLFIIFYVLSFRRTYRLKPRFELERGLKG